MHYEIFYNGGSSKQSLKFKKSETELLEKLGLKTIINSTDINEVKTNFDSYITPETLEDPQDQRLKDYLQHCVTECGGHNIKLGNTLPEEFAREGPNGPRPEGNNLGVLEKYQCNWHNNNCDTMCYGDIYKKMDELSKYLEARVNKDDQMLNLLELLKEFYSKSVDTGSDAQKLLAQRIEIAKELRKVTRDLEDITKKINKLEKDRDGTRMKMLKKRFQEQIDDLDPEKNDLDTKVSDLNNQLKSIKKEEDSSRRPEKGSQVKETGDCVIREFTKEEVQNWNGALVECISALIKYFQAIAYYNDNLAVYKHLRVTQVYLDILDVIKVKYGIDNKESKAFHKMLIKLKNDSKCKPRECPAYQKAMGSPGYKPCKNPLNESKFVIEDELKPNL
jgi:hypothetical protein